MGKTIRRIATDYEDDSEDRWLHIRKELGSLIYNAPEEYNMTVKEFSEMLDISIAEFYKLVHGERSAETICKRLEQIGIDFQVTMRLNWDEDRF